MTFDIETYVSTCELCRKFESSQQKEILQPFEVTHRPWSKVGCDLFTFNSCEYLVIVHYFSNYFKLAKLGQSTLAQRVINKLKCQFSLHGTCISGTIISDNGPQFMCEDTKLFSKQWDFEHLTKPSLQQSIWEDRVCS